MATNNLICAKDLQEILGQFDTCALECDGMTFVLSALLESLGQPHQRMIGSVRSSIDDAVVSPHCWILLSDGMVVDYRLRMWLGQDAAIPHGVFAADQSAVVYTGQKSHARMPPAQVIDMLSDGRYSAALDLFRRRSASN
jgi:hypothetical protein